jgi:hypothetical protein
MVTWEWEDYDVDLTTSLQDLVWIWTFMLAEGYFSWNEVKQDWDSRFVDLPVPMRRWV